MGTRTASVDYSAQFASLNVKLDKILSIIAPVKVGKVEMQDFASTKKEKIVKEKKVKTKKVKTKKK